MRVPLLAGIILGGATIVGHTVFSDVVTGDFQAYYYGAQAAFDGESLYFDRGYEGGYYIYPPVTLVYFALYSELPFLAGYGLHTLVSVVVATLVARATIDVIRRHTTLTTADAVLVWAFFLFSSCAIASLSLGQVNILILGLIVLGYLQLERGQSLRSGASFAVAATPKLFPTLLGVYLLANRNWRATAAAITTGVGGIVLGAALFGVGLTENFFLWLVRDQGIKTDGLSANTVPPADLFIVTLARPLANFFPTFGFWEYLLLSITILAVPLAYVYTGSYRYDRLVGLLATLVAMVVIIPPQLIYGLFIYFPLLVLYYAVEDTATRLLFGSSLILVNFTFVPEMLSNGLQALPIPTVAVTTLIDAVSVVLQFASVPLIGLVAALIGCVRHRYVVGGSVGDG